MERESFEDEDVARVLNDSFISIKVDREERPDIDQVYMNACVALNGSGGWPLSAFITQDRKPFFAGTYFPKTDRGGQIGFLKLLARLSNLWNKERDKIEQTSTQFIAALSRLGTSETLLNPQAPQTAADALVHTYDRRWGGFGGAPKFPSPHHLLFLLRMGKRPESAAWQAVAGTLDGMAAGGLRDHIGGGFCRYATDEKWLVPHFEKMLYDNAMLCMAYTEAWQAMGREEWRDIAHETLQFVEREMTDTSGGFYTAQDADSEGVEGKYYVWTRAEVEAVLGHEIGARFCHLFDITPTGNFEGNNIPNHIGRTLSKDEILFARNCFPRLYQARLKRAKPFRDEKILLNSNALMIAALAKAGAAFEDSEYLSRAQRAARLLLDNMRPNGRLRAVYKGGEASKPATLDGYAYLVWGLIELYAASFDVAWLAEALAINEQMLGLFGADDGGLYFSGYDVEDLPLRTMDMHDGATPSGYSVAAMNNLRLSHYTGKFAWEERAQALLDKAADDLTQAPEGYTWLLAAMAYLHEHGTDVVIAQSGEHRDFSEVLKGFHPYVTVLRRDPQFAGDVDVIAPFTANMGPVNGQPAAYVCQGGHCHRPLTDPSQLRAMLHTEIQ